MAQRMLSQDRARLANSEGFVLRRPCRVFVFECSEVEAAIDSELAASTLVIED